MVKVLVCGDVRGNFTALFDQVNRINTSRAGPFDVLFCVGTFFSPTIIQKQEELLNIKISIPTYFICSKNELTENVMTFIGDGYHQGKEIKSNF